MPPHASDARTPLRYLVPTRNTPGQPVSVSLDFTASDRSGTFTSVWHMRDAHGQASFPREFCLQVVVTVVGF
jgi:hypothetical protein